MTRTNPRAFVERERQNILETTTDQDFGTQTEAIEFAYNKLVPNLDNLISGPYKAVEAFAGNCFAFMALTNILKPPTLSSHMSIKVRCSGDPHFATLLTQDNHGLLLDRFFGKKSLNTDFCQPGSKVPREAYFNRLQNPKPFLGVFAVESALEGWETIVLETPADALEGRILLDNMGARELASIIVPMEVGMSIIDSFPDGISMPEQWTNRPEPAKITFLDDMLKVLSRKI